MADNKNDTLFNHTSHVNHSNEPSWNVTVIIETAITVFSLCLILLVFLPFLWERKLHTPFNIYVLNLLLADFLWFALQNPFDIINNLYSIWNLNYSACTFYLYTQYICIMGQQFAHVLISTNRLWAVTFVNSYKRNHTAFIAGSICVGSWIFSHVVILPGLMMDAVYYHGLLEDNVCVLETTRGEQKIWIVAVQLVFCLQELVVLGAYPIIWYKRRERRKIGVGVETGSLQSQRQSSNSRSRAPRRSKSNSFLLLTILTTMVLLFWTPSNAYYTALPFLDSFDPAIGSTLLLVNQFQLLSDPIIFCLALKDLRDAVTRLVTRPFVKNHNIG